MKLQPMYYAHVGAMLWFAFQVKALTAGRTNLSFDPSGQAGFYLWDHFITET